jgi:hypothetical protein
LFLFLTPKPPVEINALVLAKAEFFVVKATVTVSETADHRSTVSPGMGLSSVFGMFGSQLQPFQNHDSSLLRKQCRQFLSPLRMDRVDFVFGRYRTEQEVS